MRTGSSPYRSSTSAQAVVYHGDACHTNSKARFQYPGKESILFGFFKDIREAFLCLRMGLDHCGQRRQRFKILRSSQPVHWDCLQ